MVNGYVFFIVAPLRSLSFSPSSPSPSHHLINYFLPLPLLLSPFSLSLSTNYFLPLLSPFSLSLSNG
jgi:hypothetical protein